MTLGDIIVLGVLGLIIGVIIANMLLAKKKSSCCGCSSCQGCAMAGKCHQE